MYDYWREHGQLLPHPHTLRKYKNCLDQKPGFQLTMLKWMKQEAMTLGLKGHQLWGAIILDEMSIQQDLSCYHKSFHTYYAGQVVITPHCEALIKQRKGVQVIFTAYLYSVIFELNSIEFTFLYTQGI